MSQEKLKWLRLITPGIMVLIFTGLLGTITGLFKISVPTDLKDIGYSLSVLILAGIYYVLPFRKWANQTYFNQISENIRSRMIKISGLEDDPNLFTWKAVRGIFYHFVDTDKSLTAKSKNAYFNGYMWTTIADLRALSVVFAALSFFLFLLGYKLAIISALLFLMLALISFYGSRVVTRLHKEIGDEQIEIIEHKYRDELKAMLGNVRERSDK